MTLRRVQLPPNVSGALWLGSMPGRFEPWSAFLEEARAARIGQVVCLTPRTEMAELAAPYHAAVVGGRLPFRWTQLAMRNFGLPENVEEFREGVRDVAVTLQRGESVLLHCAAGLGRTGSAAACVLKALGLDTPTALQRVRDAGSNPQNAQQSGFVDWF
ncbi:tyrosine-protein phosphatase [Ramlibacter sp. AN1015]|uniref:protein-tyrosine phosphatase family protein n=1 Tax=Ramlibacter sp. AN1015 TaxID=3133428 RepID=UPI0030BBE4A0